jgi:hypothetical protein
MDKLSDLITPIIKGFVSVDRGDEDGYLDKVVDPVLLLLAEEIPGVSKILGKPYSVLDVAEIFVPKSRPGAAHLSKYTKS